MKNTTVDVKPVWVAGPNGRRNFLKMSGLALAGTGLLIAGCSDDDDSNAISDEQQRPGVRNGVFDLGGGDLGILTYAYALEQLEANFYTQVVNHSAFRTTFSNPLEQEILIDLYNHEVIHREFFRTALTGALAEAGGTLLPDLAFNYAGLNFADRAKVLATAMALEDTGVKAYNGAGQYLENATYLLLAGKIVSVEARHAAAIRNLISPGTAYYAGDDVVDPTTGFDKAEKPSLIVPQVKPFFTTNFTAQYLK